VADDRVALAQGWTGPKEVDGKQTEGSWRSHQVPFGDMEKPEHVQLLEDWMQSYRPEELFDASGRLKPELAELAPAASVAWEPIPTPTRGAAA